MRIVSSFVPIYRDRFSYSLPAGRQGYSLVYGTNLDPARAGLWSIFFEPDVDL